MKKEGGRRRNVTVRERIGEREGERNERKGGEQREMGIEKENEIDR